MNNPVFCKEQEVNMAQVQKKILSEYFKKVISGEKKTELRLADFEIKPGDTLALIEIDDVT